MSITECFECECGEIMYKDDEFSDCIDCGDSLCNKHCLKVCDSCLRRSCEQCSKYIDGTYYCEDCAFEKENEEEEEDDQEEDGEEDEIS